jgi:membrane protein DedA with SNARE-associated domain
LERTALFFLLSVRQYYCKEVSVPVFELFSASAIDYWVAYLTYSPYITIFLLLIAGIWFIPLAEEIALVAAGYLYYSDQVQLTTMLMLLGLGVFCGDFVGFWVGRHWRGRSPRLAFPFLRHSKWVERFKTWLDQHRNRALFLTRFLPGLRLPAHIIVGAHGMPTPIYVRISLIAIVVYVPIIFTLAYSFGAEIDAALASIQRLGHVTWGLLLVAVIVWSLIRFWITRESLFDQPQ